MAFFKPGDRVTVRTDLDQYGHYYMDGKICPDSMNSTMLRMLGETVTICAVKGSGKYSIAECGYNWTDEMFEEYINRNAAPLETGQAASPDDIISMLYVGSCV